MAKKKGKLSPKKAAPKRKRKPMDIQDLKRAEMDPVLRYKMSLKNTAPMIVTAKDRILVRHFATKTFQVAKQRDSGVTLAELQKRLIEVLKSMRPDMRKIMLEQMRDYVEAE